MTANYVLLEKITVGAAGASSVTFSSIPQTGYTDLLIKVSGRSARAGQQADNLFITFNGNGSSYTTRSLSGNGTSASSANTTSRYASFAVDAAGSTASTFSNHEIYIPNYASANNKSYSVDSVSENNATGAQSDLFAGLWSNTAAITSIGLQPEVSTWEPNTTFYLYGVAKLGTTPAIVPYATGGDTIMTDGTYWYHAFRSSGTFTPTKSVSADILVVAGGGGGSQGGGGAGGLLGFTAQTLITNNYTITIGAGGAGISNTAGNQTAFSGSNSTFQGLTAAVGGGGAGDGANGLNGGSGGGGGYGSPTRTGGTATSGQGNNGGSGGGFSDFRGGGGGGAGAAGGNSNGTSQAGNGGIGSTAYSSWGSVTGTGQNSGGTFYFAGGGGGGSINSGAGSGGLGGGGNGSLRPNAGASGTANTGGGAGGAESAGGNGGSGIIIVRYLV